MVNHGHAPDIPLRLIASPAEAEARRAELEVLLRGQPRPGTAEAERAKLLAVLLERYESESLGPVRVDAVSAIEFRLEQLGLSPRALEPYIGARSRVSEVLSGRRALTRDMAQALHRGLGIPAEALLSDRSTALEDETTADIEWHRFPLREMVRRGYLAGISDVRGQAAEALDRLRAFIAVGGREMSPAYFRRTMHTRIGRALDGYALTAWTLRVLHRAIESPKVGTFDRARLTPEWFRSLARLSTTADMLPAVELYLATAGVVLVLEPHLPRTRLDGAAMRAPDGRGVVALTLRHARLDNFWFTLMHELAHLALHVGDEDESEAVSLYYDDLDVRTDLPQAEREADLFAREALVPSVAWHASSACYTPSADSIDTLAQQIGIHSAIVAGYAQFENNNYRMLRQVVDRHTLTDLRASLTLWEEQGHAD